MLFFLVKIWVVFTPLLKVLNYKHNVNYNKTGRNRTKFKTTAITYWSVITGHPFSLDFRELGNTNRPLKFTVQENWLVFLIYNFLLFISLIHFLKIHLKARKSKLWLKQGCNCNCVQNIWILRRISEEVKVGLLFVEKK